QAHGLFSSILPVGQIIGPNLGGWMTSSFGWRSIFWINIPLGIIALIAAFFLLSEGKKEDHPVDIVGSGLLVGSLGSFFMALSDIAGDVGTSRMLVGSLFIFSAVCMILFIRRENKVKYPLIDLAVMREKPFIAANVYNFIFGGAFGALALIPLYAVSIYGMSTMESGLILTPRSVGMMLAATITSLSLVRWGYRRPMLIGTSIMLPSFILLVLEPSGVSFLTLHFGSKLFMLTTMGIVGLGIGMTAQPQQCFHRIDAGSHQH
ncbi:MAG: MFS transporter, partial [Syntrophales bacterium LBB04]|nr:MFS transporter [Syntrophales bacterium LBB04]